MKQYLCVSLCLWVFVVISPTKAHALLNKPAMARAQRESIQRTLYEISVQIDPKAQKYDGHQKVTFVNRHSQSTNYLLFFAYPNDPGLTNSNKRYLSVSNVKVNGMAAKLEENGPFLRILLGNNLPFGKTVVVDFDFLGTLQAQKGNKDLFSEALDELLR